MNKRSFFCVPLIVSGILTLFSGGCSGEPEGIRTPERKIVRKEAVKEKHAPMVMNLSRAKAAAMTESALPRIMPPPALDRPPWNTEEYKHFEENPFYDVTVNPLSTFGADVDTASYTNARRYLQKGSYLPPKDSIRVEEFLNFFRYRYREPRKGELFDVTFEMTDAPWKKGNKLLLLGVQAKNVEKKSLSPAHFVFLVDRSGSMRRWMDLVKSSMKMLAKELRSCDKVSLVTYGGGVQVLADGISGSEKEKLSRMITQLRVGGYTPGGQAIQKAYELARKHFIKNGNNRIVLISDGDFNVGASSESALVELVEKERKSFIYLTVIGVGYGNYKDNKMKMLANKGNGNYVYLDNLRAARNVLVNEMSSRMFTLAKDVKFQVEFNPALIRSYRLIGYEMRRLAARDFRDDSKDSGDVGVGHQVTVLYELVMEDGKKQKDGIELKYQKRSNTNSGELLTCRLRYQLPQGDQGSVERSFVLKKVPEGTENIFWASAVAEFAMYLRGSEHALKTDLKKLRSYAQKYLGKDPDGDRAEFLTMIRNAENLKRP